MAVKTKGEMLSNLSCWSSMSFKHGLSEMSKMGMNVSSLSELSSMGAPDHEWLIDEK